ncbi:hypothetical protein, partial [Roseibium denhamense]|uniref:hypothetical protein n=1 Tax=Roseibium denhamense TaxID=76305 RepID=UPI001AD9271F
RSGVRRDGFGLAAVPETTQPAGHAVTRIDTPRLRLAGPGCPTAPKQPGRGRQAMPKKHYPPQDAQAEPDASRHSCVLQEMFSAKRQREPLRRVLCCLPPPDTVAN